MPTTGYGTDTTERNRTPIVSRLNTINEKGESIMKKTNKEICLLMIAGLLLFSATHAQAIPIVKLEVPDPFIAPGETFVINVIVNGVTDLDPFLGSDELLAFGFDVISPSSVTFNGATVGHGFFDDSALFLDTDVAGSAFPGISGNDILLASLSFSATSVGSYLIGIQSDIFNPNQGLITWLHPQIDATTFSRVSVSVSVPEPPTILLLFLGLVGAGVVRIKRR